MKILIDLQAMQSPSSRSRGIGRYSLALAKAMIRVAQNHEIWILLNSSHQETIDSIVREFAPILPAERILKFTAPAYVQPGGFNNDWANEAAEKIRESFIKFHSPDVLHIASFFESEDCVVSIPPRDTGIVTCVTLYDLIPMLFPERYLESYEAKTRYLRRVENLKKADRLLAISMSAANDAKLMLPEARDSIVNISSAVDEDFETRHALTEEQIEATLEKFGLVGPFVMYTGGNDWRKNVNGLLTAYAGLPENVRNSRKLALVFHIEKSVQKELETLSAKLKIGKSSIVFTGRVSDAELVALYKRCALFVFPSFYEGFGLPVLEAMKCGAIVIGSDASSVSEAIGKQEALFNPHVVPAMTALIQRALLDEKFRIELKEHAKAQSSHFSWENSARRALLEMEGAIEERLKQGEVNAENDHVGELNNSEAICMRVHNLSTDLGVEAGDDLYHRLLNSIAKIPGKPSDEDMIGVAVAISRLPYLISAKESVEPNNGI